MSSYCMSSRVIYPIWRDVTKWLEIKEHLELVWFCLRKGNSLHRGDSQSSSSHSTTAWEAKPRSFDLWESDHKHKSSKQFLLLFKVNLVKVKALRWRRPCLWLDPKSAEAKKGLSVAFYGLLTVQSLCFLTLTWLWSFALQDGYSKKCLYISSIVNTIKIYLLCVPALVYILFNQRTK